MREVGSQGCAVSSGGSHIFSSARTDGVSGSGAGIDSDSESGSWQKVYRKWPVACRSGEISAVCGLQKKTMELR